MTPKLIVEQKITAFVNKYAVFGVNTDGTKGTLVALAQQKRLAFKEKVTFYSDLIGCFKKDFGASILKSTWQILDAQGQPAMVVAESNLALALLRRFVDFIPIVGGVLELVTLLFRYHFDVTDLSTNQIVGKYHKTTLFRDHYELSLDDSAYAKQDWRVYAALAVALDALQSR